MEKYRKGNSRIISIIKFIRGEFMKRKLLIIFILIVAIMIPCFSYIYKNIIIKNSTQLYNIEAVGGIKKGNKLTQ